jgi:hypothetical protein
MNELQSGSVYDYFKAKIEGIPTQSMVVIGEIDGFVYCVPKDYFDVQDMHREAVFNGLIYSRVDFDRWYKRSTR